MVPYIYWHQVYYSFFFHGHHSLESSPQDALLDCDGALEWLPTKGVPCFIGFMHVYCCILGLNTRHQPPFFRRVRYCWEGDCVFHCGHQDLSQEMSLCPLDTPSNSSYSWTCTENSRIYLYIMFICYLFLLPYFHIHGTYSISSHLPPLGYTQFLFSSIYVFATFLQSQISASKP